MRLLPVGHPDLRRRVARAQSKPARVEIIAALDPHLCRCGMHNRVIRAVERAAAAGGASA